MCQINKLLLTAKTLFTFRTLHHAMNTEGLGIIENQKKFRLRHDSVIVPDSVRSIGGGLRSDVPDMQKYIHLNMSGAV